MSGKPGVHRVVLRPGDRVEVVLTEQLVNGYRDELATVAVVWQDRDAPAGEVATKHRELQIDWSIGAAQGRVGPVVVTQR